MHEADDTENRDQDIDELQEDCATGLLLYRLFLVQDDYHRYHFSGVHVPISQQDDAAIENSAGSKETPSLGMFCAANKKNISLSLGCNCLQMTGQGLPSWSVSEGKNSHSMLLIV